jgi:hypothetical protein
MFARGVSSRSGGSPRGGSRTREQPLYSNTGPIGSDLSYIGPGNGGTVVRTRDRSTEPPYGRNQIGAMHRVAPSSASSRTRGAALAFRRNMLAKHSSRVRPRARESWAA